MERYGGPGFVFLQFGRAAGERIAFLSRDDPTRFTLMLGGPLQDGTARSSVLFVELERAANETSKEPWRVLSTKTVWID